MSPWTLLSAALAPILLVGGFTLAAAQQPAFDGYTQTISALAALDAHARWIMTGALMGLGLCHVVTALGLHTARSLGRVTLALGGLCTWLVAAFPLAPDSDGAAHVRAASAAFLCLAVWPLFALTRAPDAARALRPRLSILAALTLLALLAWLGWAIERRSYVGLAERVAAAAQALWPLYVALSVQRSRNALHAR